MDEQRLARLRGLAHLGKGGMQCEEAADALRVLVIGKGCAAQGFEAGIAHGCEHRHAVSRAAQQHEQQVARAAALRQRDAREGEGAGAQHQRSGEQGATVKTGEHVGLPPHHFRGDEQQRERLPPAFGAGQHGPRRGAKGIGKGGFGAGDDILGR